MANHLTLAVAGSGKTRGIVEHCASLPCERRALVLTYTQANQSELRGRLSRYAGDRSGIEVMGWFAFLLRHFARPFLPFRFPGQRILGFNFDGRPHRMATGAQRFLDRNRAAYACELGRLAHELIDASGGTLMRRLECVYGSDWLTHARQLLVCCARVQEEGGKSGGTPLSIRSSSDVIPLKINDLRSQQGNQC